MTPTDGGDAQPSQANDTGKPGFVPPKLTFVVPKLVHHGSLTEVTRGFFGTFSP